MVSHFQQTWCSRGCSTINPIFKKSSIPNRKSQGAEILREYSPPPSVTFHVSHVTCHMSQSCVTCQMSKFTCIFFYKLVDLICRESVINGAYPLQFKELQGSHRAQMYSQCWTVYITWPSSEPTVQLYTVQCLVGPGFTVTVHQKSDISVSVLCSNCHL